jgi:hypothetical protein
MNRVVRSALLFAVSLLATLPAIATTVTDLYDISVPLDAGGQDAAFLEALKQVAVRVSGQRDAAIRLGPTLTNPRQYAQRFNSPKGMLQVGFDSVAIDKLLSTAGLPIWGRERPATLVLLNIRELDGSTRWADVQFGGAERETVSRVARQRGLPLIWPTIDASEQARIYAAGFKTAELLQIAARFGANATLLGFAQRGSGNSLTVRWVLSTEDGATEVESVLDEGVHLAADTFARAYGASGTAVDNVLVEISGISNLAAYAAAVNYLEGMTLVRGMALEQMSGDKMRLRLAVRGDAATLRRSMTLDKRLVLQPPEPGAPRPSSLQFRYQPLQ